MPMLYQPFERLLHTIVLHQTTTVAGTEGRFQYCFIPLFYIKPQHSQATNGKVRIASYHCSTSNHNHDVCHEDAPILLHTIVLHQTQPVSLLECLCSIASYHCSTSNHNKQIIILSYFILLHTIVLHQTTTSSTALERA